MYQQIINKILLIVKNRLFVLFKTYWLSHHKQICEQAYELASKKQTLAYITYMQSALQEGYPINVIVSQKLADSEFYILIGNSENNSNPESCLQPQDAVNNKKILN